MNFFAVVIFECTFVLGGCATTPPTGAQTASATDDTYTPIGSAIARKETATPTDNTVNLQQLQNERDMGGGVNNVGH